MRWLAILTVAVVALGTAAGAASLRAATYRTDATGERALNSVVTATFHRCRWLPIG